jgi:hypothetical protein
VSKWRQICENAIPEFIEPDSNLEHAISTGFQELEKNENLLNFLVTYKVRSPKQLFYFCCKTYHICFSLSRIGLNCRKLI